MDKYVKVMLLHGSVSVRHGYVWINKNEWHGDAWISKCQGHGHVWIIKFSMYLQKKKPKC